MFTVEEMSVGFKRSFMGHVVNLAYRKFLRYLHKYVLVFGKVNGVGTIDVYGLILQADEIAFTGAGFRVVSWVMLKLADIKIAAKLTVDTL